MINRFIKFFVLIALVLSSEITIASSVKPEGFAQVVKPLIPAVVNISTVLKEKKRSITPRAGIPEGSPLFEEFNQLFEMFKNSPYGSDEFSDSSKGVSLGSGFIISADGYIVTGNHVINAASEITVKLNDGSQHKAKLIGVDEKTDLALLKIEAKKELPFVKFGDSDKAQVGDWIIAIGNPFGLGGTVTSGIISANGRDINLGGVVDNFIQTDAAINKGNSGGPMFNIDGEVIGVNLAIYSPSGDNIGIGFAVPSSVVKNVIEQIKKSGKVYRGKLGVKIQAITSDIAESLSMHEDEGVLIAEVEPGSPAEKSGLKFGDVVISFNGKKIDKFTKLPRLVAESPIGKEVEFEVKRGKDILKLKATLIESKDDKETEELAQENELKEFDSSVVEGASFAKITPRLKGKYGLPENLEGFIILKTEKNSVWSKRKFFPGDIVTSIGGKKLENINDLRAAIKESKASNKPILLLVIREGRSQFLTMSFK